MHEAKLCMALLRLADTHCAQAGAARVTALRIEVGAFSGVSPEALARAFPICANGTLADGATLRIDPTPGRELRLADMEVV